MADASFEGYKREWHLRSHTEQLLAEATQRGAQLGEQVRLQLGVDQGLSRPDVNMWHGRSERFMSGKHE